MAIQEIQRLIDAEKPAFDYARMFLTTVAWWTIMILLFTSIFTNQGAHWSIYVVFGPILTIGALFGCLLAFRINLLTEKISEILLHNIGTISIFIRIPLNFILFLLPISSAFLIVWVIMFSRVTGK